MSKNRQDAKSKVQQLFDEIETCKDAIYEAREALAFAGMEPEWSSVPGRSNRRTDPAFLSALTPARAK